MRTVALAIAVFGLAECTHDDGLSVPAPPVLTTVTVSVEVTAAEVGQPTIARAATFDQFGAPISAGPATFTSSAPEVAAIGPQRGNILAIGPGTTEITATVDGKSGRQALTVSTAAIRINEVAPRGNAADGWVELFNPTASAIDLADWTVTDDDVFRIFTLPAGTTIPPRGFLVIDQASFPAGLQATDAVHLFSRFGVQADAFAWAQVRDTTYGRCSDGTGDFLALEPTRGAPNACPD